jgi:molybdopterin-binding protein
MNEGLTDRLSRWIHPLPGRDIPPFSGARIAAMKISARNQLRGTVEEIVRGVITAKVSVRVGENLIESVITLQSADEMGIKKGDTITALIKSTEVLLMTD